MVLISVDFPHPFGPRMHTCSPAAISSVMSSKAGRCSRAPRKTVTCSSESSGGAGAVKKEPGVILAQHRPLREGREGRLCHSFKGSYVHAGTISKTKGGENRFVLTSRGGWGVS